MVVFSMFDNLSYITVLSRMLRHTCMLDFSKKQWWLHRWKEKKQNIKKLNFIILPFVIIILKKHTS